MKKAMAVWIVLFGLSAFAQSPEIIKLAVKNYEKALKSPSSSMVESSIFHVARLKLFYPTENTEGLAKQLERLQEKGHTPTIRYKAYLALQLLNYPVLFANLDKKNYTDSDQFFRLVSQEMQTRLLAGRDR